MVTTTARWPERLGHVATLLRAEAAAVLTVSGNDVAALFVHRVDPSLDWLALLGATVVERALRSPVPIGAALPAGRWDDRVAYAVLARLETLDMPAVLCLLRHAVPFDPVELASAEAAGALLAIGAADSRAAARETDLAAIPTTAPTSSAAEQGAEVRATRPALRIVVAEGEPATRIGLQTLLTGAGLQVVGATATWAEAFVIARDRRADVALIDIASSGDLDLASIERFTAAARHLPVVAFISDASDERLRALLAAGASGIVTRNAPPERIFAALQAAANGLTAVPRSSAAHAGSVVERAQAEPAAQAAEPAERAPSLIVPLTPRELDLLRYLAQGHTNKEIARAMVLAEDTVKKAVQTVIAKLNATDRTNAVVVALRNALID